MNQKGFSLIELLVVVSIVITVAALAIPALWLARKSANEAAAVGYLRSLVSAEFTYAARNNQNFGSLGNLNSQGYVDSRFSASGNIVNGYQYNDNYSVQGVPSGTPTSIPSGFGFEAVHQGTAADYDFEVGVDTVIRYGPSAAPGKREGDAVGK